MPVNYLEISNQIPEFCEHARQRQELIGEYHTQAHDLLLRPGWDLEQALAAIRAAGQADKTLRCALPEIANFAAVFPVPDVQFRGTIVAADGSQVFPSRHRQVEFGVINLAAVEMQPGSGKAPLISRQSQLLDVADLDMDEQPLSEGFIALKRDLEERRLLVQRVKTTAAPVVTLTDGGMELFREPGASAQYRQALHEYLDVLKELGALQAISAGYVDKPGSSLVVRMLEVLSEQGGKPIKLTGLIDRILFEDILSIPGCRSAVFGIQSTQSADFSGDCSVHFFYINVSMSAEAKIARVEIPGWVSAHESMVNLLHKALLEQCSASGSDYPYLLHRAHEEAVIKFEDAAHLEEMILNTMMSNGIPVGKKSAKQSMKDLDGKQRMGK